MNLLLLLLFRPKSTPISNQIYNLTHNLFYYTHILGKLLPICITINAKQNHLSEFDINLSILKQKYNEFSVVLPPALLSSKKCEIQDYLNQFF